MRQRNPSVGRNSECGTNAGYHFERDSRRPQSLTLFRSSSKQKRIAALQPHNPLTPNRMINQQRIDLGLWRLITTTDFSNVDTLGALRNVAKKVRIHKIVVD